MDEHEPQVYAHTIPGSPRCLWEPLAKHLSEVEQAASSFASTFGAEAWGAVLGSCHDLGKYSEAFQDYLRQTSGEEAADAGEESASGRRVDHSTYGARYVAQKVGGLAGQLLAFCIAGHHAGLPNEAASDDATQRSTLRFRLSEHYPIAKVDYYRSIPAPALSLSLKPLSRSDYSFQLAFFVRMLFSCLVDADRSCTEGFCDPARADERRVARPSVEQLRDQLDLHLASMQSFAQLSPINERRRDILEQCRLAAELKPGFFSLQVPTGGGKTLSSLAFALRHASAYKLRRVVVAIPFTSIIEQTADVYRKALDQFAAEGLIEHHTNLEPDRATRANQLGAENWDAPLVVTTNVQLLESLFAAATTPCRKLHRLTNSVIILDEAQMLPVELLQPTLAALRELALNYGCSIVLCTATQPALELREGFPLGLSDVRPIIDDPKKLFAEMRRVEVRHAGKLEDSELAGRLAAEQQVLCIVNTRRHAARLFSSVAALSEPGTCFHLSTLMCGAHRRAALLVIRERLMQAGACRVISTQLIEAGVDIDLPVVYRAAAGFDSIAQAAGRCNREGSLPLGTTFVFDGEELPPRGLLRDSASTAHEIWQRFSDPLSPEAVEAYFRLYYWKKQDKWDKKGIMAMMRLDRARPHRASFQFRDIASAYRLIEDNQLPILIPYDKTAQEFSYALLNERVDFVPSRKLQPYLVSVPERTLQGMEASGIIRRHDSGVCLLLRNDAYTQAKGLTVESMGLDPSLWGL